MKKSLVILAAMALVIAMVGGASAATTTDTIAATATITTSCSMTGGAIAFGTVDAETNAAGGTATITNPAIYCTNTLPVAVSDDKAGSSNMTDGAAHNIAYSFTYATSLTGGGTAVDIGASLNLAATFAAGALNALPAGTYSDSIVFTLTF